MTDRIINFNAGPSAIPLPVLEKAKEELLNYHNSGMSIMETSHRAKEFDDLLGETQKLAHKLLGIGDNYKVMFMGGGASLQFAMIAMNLMNEGRTADYVNTGTWSTKAIKEAKIIGEPLIAASSEETNFNRIPGQDELVLNADASYVHITSNNTIKGTQWVDFPDTGNVPLVVDMSSDILSKRYTLDKVGMIYAGAQKNLGPSGVTMIIMRDDMIEKCKGDALPTMLRYQTLWDKNSLYNTPPTFPIYLVKLALEWIDGQGGLEAVEKINRAKGDLLYGLIDEMTGFYKGATEKTSRSLMNVCFRLPTEDLEKKLIADGREAGFNGLKGHRSVGGIRVSMYNAISLDNIKTLVEYLKDFARKNG
jgi:phosphoserine aminotransferase